MDDPPAHRFQVLALSGGGYRGLYTARVLADLEDAARLPLAKCFDLIAGTSIGGILALALAMEIPASRLVELFETKGEAIFRARRTLLGMLRAKYTQRTLAKELETEGLFGERLLGYAKHPVIVPAINYSTGLPVVFKTPHHPDLLTDHKHRVVDVALATSAAPMYFPRHCFNDHQFVDGGFYANAPGLMGLHEAEHFFGQARKDVHLLSIGTMSSRFTVDPRRNRSGGTLDWGGWSPAETPKRLFGVSISAQESAVDNMLKQMLKPDRYHHIDALLTDEQAGAVGLDKTGPGAREVLLGAAKNSSRDFLGKAAARALLNHRAAAPVFFHGPRTAEVQ